jgi:lysophospholipase L1-like esterase
MNAKIFTLVLAVGCCCPLLQAETQWRFTCASSKHNRDKTATQLTVKDLYSANKQFGFDLGTAPNVKDGVCFSGKPFFFSLAVPEGNYKITVELGGGPDASVTTVKAESRRLMLFSVATSARQTTTRKFNVNVRTPQIEGDGEVHLKPREIGSLDWDDKLTLEFIGQNPSFRSLTISKADVPAIYLAGDSTVVDQDKEPWAAWGQMLPVFFNDSVSISDQAESGETIHSFTVEDRFAKIFNTMRAGDYLFMQFAHNDQKPGKGFVSVPAYKEYLVKYIEMARSKGATPVLVTSMNRRTFDANGKIIQTLGDYPEAMREVAKEQNVALVDLNAMSKTLYEALGPEGTLKAFVHFPANTFPDQPLPLKDDTHFTDYGAYELARCVVKGIREAGLSLASAIVKGETEFDPAHPDNPNALKLPLDPQVSTVTPYGR